MHHRRNRASGQELSYDAWGNRRDLEKWAVYTTLSTGILLARGFTGHEHLDLFDLINMDGRVYDPVLGRFLSPDPIIQNPENLQNLNRYTYCLNNPLSLTDPSGYSWLSDNWRSLVSAAVAISVSAISFGSLAPLGAAILAGGLVGFAGGLTGALLSGANLGQAFTAGIVGGLIGAASGFLNFASGTISGLNPKSLGSILERAAKHTFSNTWLNGMTGGDVKHGFITSALSSVGNGIIDSKLSGLAPKVACAAALGGSVEEIGGGKFANGAITGAYGMLFNELMHEEDDPPGKNNNSSEGDNSPAPLPSVDVQQAGNGGEHLIGPGLIALGEPINALKPIGALGSKTGSSIASKTLSKVIPNTFTKTLGKEVGQKVVKFTGTNVIGRALGRLVPYVGWGVTAYDFYNNRATIWEGIRSFGAGAREFSVNNGVKYYVCFGKGTLVLLGNGLKPIEQVNIGDSVYSYNFVRKSIELCKVVRIFENQTNEIFEITTNKEKIFVTAQHPFYVKNKGWVKVKDLQINDTLATKDRFKVQIKNIVKLQQSEIVYNIEVEGNHNYFVSNSTILVHNK